ncbi:hypothetical protein NE237_007785 [Protea cynaroides]|uniref:Uncharacterized protein n=1 Tax=Protea cynaroides TaxID=273540 RepID=A0A9Q0KQQ6_9MAGN|nr:hypothetical protein NE237_007785 [Protea cynaroides]
MAFAIVECQCVLSLWLVADYLPRISEGQRCCSCGILTRVVLILFPGLWLSEIMPNSYKVPDIHEPGKVTDLVLQYSNAIPAIDHSSATINGKRDLFEAVCTQ